MIYLHGFRFNVMPDMNMFDYRISKYNLSYGLMNDIARSIKQAQGDDMRLLRCRVDAVKRVRGLVDGMGIREAKDLVDAALWLYLTDVASDIHGHGVALFVAPRDLELAKLALGEAGITFRLG